MENAVDALQIAAFLLIFVLALTISINAFSEARQTIQLLINYQDREYEYTYVEDNGTTERIVSAETIVPSIYKAYKENYKIVFKGLSEPLYEKAGRNNERIKVYSIDLEEKDVALGSDAEKERFITALLYGSKNTQIVENFKNSGIFLNGNDFYDIIKEKQFKESLGVYYQEEIQGPTDTPEANRTRKRVITYEVI